MSSYGNPPQDPYGAQPPPGQYGTPYGQPGQQYGYAGGPAPSYANWGKRVGAYLVDLVVLMVAMIPYIIGSAMMGASVETTVDPATGMATATSGPSGISLVLMVLGGLLGLAVFIWNICLKQGRTGYSIGKGVLGIKLVKEQTGQPIGAGMAFVRQIAHILDSIPCYIGYLWPLWDAKRQTFADKVVGTVVLDQPKG